MASTSNHLNPTAPLELVPFATKWRWVLLFGPLVYGIYRLIVLVAVPLSVGQFNLLPIASGYPIIFYYGPALVFLWLMFIVHRRTWFRDIRFVGEVCRRDLLTGIAMITLLYVIEAAVEYLMGQPRETKMVSLYQFKSTSQIVVLVASLLVLPPFVEELAFRHFLLSTLPFRANRVVGAIAIVATSLYFSYIHGYQYWTTNVTIFLVGVTFGFARIRSNGMLLPIALHAYTIALALAMDQLTSRLLR